MMGSQRNYRWFIYFVAIPLALIGIWGYRIIQNRQRADEANQRVIEEQQKFFKKFEADLKKAIENRVNESGSR